MASTEQASLQSVLRPLPLLLLGVYSALFLGLFLSSLKVMVSWWGGDNYTYCYFIPFVILYLIWEQRNRLSAIPSSPSWLGLAPLVFGVFLYWLGELGCEYYTLYFSSWLILVGLSWTHFGWRKLKALHFAFILMLSMFPLPMFIYNNLSVRLQLISSRLGTALIQLFGIPALREGNVIDLGITRLQVIDACNGLRYIMPLVVLGLVLAYFFRAPLWKRALIVISTIPLAVALNGVRIALTGILTVGWGLHFAEGFYHDFAGWVVFMASLAFLLGEMWVLGSHHGVAENAEDTGEAKDEVVSRKDANTHKEKLKIHPLTRSAIFLPLIIAVILGTTIALTNMVDFRENIPIKTSFSQFPLQIGNWQGTPQKMDVKFIRELHFSDYAAIDFRGTSGDEVDFYVAYYASQRKGESIHSPSTCLPGSGWIFKESGTIVLPISSNGMDTVSVRRALIQKYNATQLVYYWFPQRGRILTNPWQLKFYNFWDALTMRRTDGALVRLITPVGQYENVKSADRRLQGFTRQVWPVLQKFLPGRRIPNS